jgi:ABC-2 type transport system permease protein
LGRLSYAFAAPTSMPDWLGAAVRWNPMSQPATAIRGEPGHVGAAVARPLALPAVFFPLAVREFGRLSR